jgi:hypothetical protein
MKQNPTDRMKDPYYAGLLFAIEQMICLADDEAKAEGMSLTDSQVRSAILKAQKLVQGGSPDIPETNERERVLAGLIHAIYHAPDEMIKDTVTADGPSNEPLPLPDWINALETIADSIKTRRSTVPGSRDYLNFVHGFISEARGMK